MRSHKLVDKRFQLKTTFTIIGITITALIALIAVTSIIIMDNNKKIATAIETLSEIGKAPDTHHHSNETKTISRSASEDTIALMQQLIRRNRIIVSAMIIITVMLSVTLYYYLINLTNRISGPIYVITHLLDDVMNGKKPDIRSLRKNDEFKDFYEQFTRLVKRIRKK